MKKNNLLYLVFHNLDEHSGIGKKILSQANSFSNAGFEVFICKLDINAQGDVESLSSNGEVIDKYIFSNKFLNRIEWRVKFEKLLRYIVEKRIDVLYIRYTHFANPFFIEFLSAIKRRKIFIIMEIPTFPYDGEYSKVKLSIKLLKSIETLARKKFKDVVNLIVNYSSNDKIFGVETLSICNGVDISKINLKRELNGQQRDVTLIAVASMEDWHGYDRLIEGFKSYYQEKPSRRVFLNLVGDSNNSVSVYYKELVDKHKLNKYITFHGFKSGRELNEIFDSSDIAIGCLGAHRKGLVYVKSLKNSEYCARGLPFIYSEMDEMFDGKSFIFKCSPDDCPVKLDDVINFYDSIKIDALEIRAYAETHLTWDIQIKKIIEKYENMRTINLF